MAAKNMKFTLKEARVRAGLGREKCAMLSGVNKVLLLRYENQQAVPGIANAAKLARVIGVELHEVREFEHAVEEATAAGLVMANDSENDGSERQP